MVFIGFPIFSHRNLIIIVYGWMNGHIIWGVRFLDLLTGPCWPSWPIGGGLLIRGQHYIFMMIIDDIHNHSSTDIFTSRLLFYFWCNQRETKILVTFMGGTAVNGGTRITLLVGESTKKCLSLGTIIPNIVEQCYTFKNTLLETYLNYQQVLYNRRY
jgi:hypothetical protein